MYESIPRVELKLPTVKCKWEKRNAHRLITFHVHNATIFNGTVEVCGAQRRIETMQCTNMKRQSNVFAAIVNDFLLFPSFVRATYIII